jgi:hypothetical protein
MRSGSRAAPSCSLRTSSGPCSTTLGRIRRFARSFTRAQVPGLSASSPATSGTWCSTAWPGPRRRGAVHQTQLALRPEAAHPLRGGALAHLGGRGRLGERPIRLDYPPSEPQPLLRREGRVTVELHPASSLGLGGLDTPSLQGGPDEQRGEVVHLAKPFLDRCSRKRSSRRLKKQQPGQRCVRRRPTRPSRPAPEPGLGPLTEGAAQAARVAMVSRDGSVRRGRRR